MLYRHLHDHGLLQISDFFMPHIADFIRAEGLRGRRYYNFYYAGDELQLDFVLLCIKVISVLFATLCRVYDCNENILPSNYFGVLRDAYC